MHIKHVCTIPYLYFFFAKVSSVIISLQISHYLLVISLAHIHLLCSVHSLLYNDEEVYQQGNCEISLSSSD